MSKITIKKRKNPFLIMSKTALNDRNLSLRAKGLIAYLLSLPDDWQIYISELQTRSKDGRDSIRSAITELLKAKYIHRGQKRENGKFSGYTYTIYEEPTTVLPKTEKPTTVIPKTANQPLVNKDNTNVLLNNFNKEPLKSTLEKDKNFDFFEKDKTSEILKSNSEKEKNSAKKEKKKLSSKLLQYLGKYINYMIAKKGKKWYTFETREMQIEYIFSLKEQFSDIEIIDSIKEAIRNSFITYNPKFNQNRKIKNGESKSQTNRSSNRKNGAITEQFSNDIENSLQKFYEQSIDYSQ